MGVAERKEREKQEMSKLILSAATKMFLEEGYEKTSIRNIAEKIEYSPATIYLYFKDKDELFFSIHQIGFQKLLLRMQNLADIKDPLLRLRKLGYEYISFAIENPEFYDLMFIMRAPMQTLKDRFDCGLPGEWNQGMTTFQFLHDTVRECIEQGRIRLTNTDLASVMCWGAVHGLVALYIRDRMKVLDFADSRMVMEKAYEETINLLAA